MSWAYIPVRRQRLWKESSKIKVRAVGDKADDGKAEGGRVREEGAVYTDSERLWGTEM